MGILSDTVNESKKNCGCGKDPCETYGKVNEAEKRWKQTSMSPEEAIAKYGKENVKVKKGALRNGDDMVEVFVESMNESGYDIAELVGDVHYHNNHYDRDERQSEMQEDAAKLMMAAKSTGDEDIIAGAESVEHLCNHYDYDETKDMLNDKLQELNQLVGGNELEVEESYSPGDEYADSEGMVSNCCGAPMMDYDEKAGFGRCGDCKDMAAGETEEEFYEAQVSRLKELSGIAEAPVEENFVDDMPYGLADGMTFTDGDPDYDYRGDPANNGEVSWPEINDWHKDENGNVKPEATMKPADFEISDLVSGLSDAQPDLLQGMTFTDGEPDYDYTGAPMNDGEVDWPEINDWHKDENGNVKPEATMKPKGFTVGDLVPF